ncbi:C45 family autoproteolytic acyltransferase/hydolase [Trinickia sp.]|uniref:C45 family autoproteolytic acyltransferase/hydolase n=1 Tax=Trinickia sp. TaxID=2571163 RepID=UPI003F7E2CD8
MPQLNCFTIAGDSAQIGRALGELAKPVFDAYMQQSAAWARLRQWRGTPFVGALRKVASERYPAYVAELDAMAAALGWPGDDLFLWNCRGELTHRAPDGCTTLAAERSMGGTGGVIAHNEDGDPHLRDKCMLVDVRPTGRPGFVSFYYPGSLPGHTFAVNRAGIAQAINNLRIVHTAPGVPRMILARAVLDAVSLDEAVAMLRDAPRASGFHHTIGCAGEAHIFSIEATPRRCSIERVGGQNTNVGRLFGHANHLVHREHELELQVVTDSSRDRQGRLAELLPQLGARSDNETLLRVLRDRAQAGLPIYRDDPRDPDDENTLATALMRTDRDGVAFEVHQHGVLVFEQFISRTAGVAAG